LSIRSRIVLLAAIPTISLVALYLFAVGITAGDALTLARANDYKNASGVPMFDLQAQVYAERGLGLLAVIVSVIVSVLIGRSIVQPLAGLRRSALQLASERPLRVAEQPRAGQDVNTAAEAPTITSGSDEIGQVRAAFDVAQRAVAEAAVDEARLRAGIGHVVRNLARRSQSLLHRQLALLDAMERRAGRPEELEDLFRIDYLTTRMRRHAEGLIVLSGEAPGRGWRNPVPLVDVLRAAAAEVEDYARIRVMTRTRAGLVGSAVADVIHLIAELAENATVFSPPHTPVRMSCDLVARGFAVEIEDRGPGIAADRLEAINHGLARPHWFDLSGGDQLGVFVAGHLASRHGIRAFLRSSPYGGTTAIVMIPRALVVDQDSFGLDRPGGRLGGHAPGEPPAESAGPRAVTAGPGAARAATVIDDVFRGGPAGEAAGKPGSEFTFGNQGRPDDPDRSGEADARVITMDLAGLGLPVRVRQAGPARRRRGRR
jgi:signal transduction histidine kinase